ncbi:olfactory receptor 1f45-like [Rhinophrynus dorsalis]
MSITNSSSAQFVLLGFSDFPQLRTYLLLVFFPMYMLTLLGNMIILSCIIYDQRLQSPMYFFLGNLSLVDICFSSSTIPTLLSTLISNTKSLSFPSCITQMFCFISFGNLENNLLAVMAYDRYVAICSPLQYHMRMSSTVCVVLVLISWTGACSHALLHTVMVTTLRYYGVKKVNHFFCEISHVLAISDTNAAVNLMLIITEGALSVATPFVCIILSYTLILVAIYHLHSTAGKHKAFSICSSHLTAVCLFYGTIISVYFRPSASTSEMGEKLSTIGYTLLTPMLNPIIYGLRNKAMKRAVNKLLSRN